MKQPKASLKLTMLLIAMAFMVTGCQKDDDNSLSLQQEQINGAPQLTLQRLTNPNISNNSKLSEKLNTINLKRNVKNTATMAREVYSPELDFTIDTSIANYISYGDYHSYTFPVSRTVDNGLLENVMLSLQADGTYLAHLISYDITEAERNLLLNNGQVPSLHNKMNSTVLLGQEWPSNILARGGGSCWDYYIYAPMCSYNQHTAEQVANGANCVYVNEGGVIQPAYTVFIIIDCDGTNPGGDFPGDPENPGYGYGWPDTGGGGPYDPNNPDPVPNEGDNCSDGLSTGFVDANGNCIPNTTVPLVKPKKEDCKKIKENITDQPVIKTRLHTLKIDSQSQEKGLRVDIHPTTGVYTPSQILDDNNGEAHINIPVNPLTVVIAHTHPPSSDYYKMFSGPDITKMGEIIKKSQNAPNPAVNPVEITHILIADGRTFAIRFDDPESVQALLEIYEDKDKKKEFERNIDNAYKKDNTGSPLFQSTTTITKQQRHLYKLFSKYSLNMSLYEANYDANGFINDWQKINKDTLEKEPCN